MKDQKDKTVATLLCFFLGGIGIHKFYLGQSGLGIIYLIFFWTFIPGIIAFFEFIILILMSEADFNRQYNPNSVSTTSTGSIKDATESLSELKKLYDQGIITAEEYEEKRKKVLDNI
jgi:TM2 domain-containing membrane protein YozV